MRSWSSLEEKEGQTSGSHGPARRGLHEATPHVCCAVGSSLSYSPEHSGSPEMETRLNQEAKCCWGWRVVNSLRKFSEMLLWHRKRFHREQVHSVGTSANLRTCQDQEHIPECQGLTISCAKLLNFHAITIFCCPRNSKICEATVL